MNGKLNEKLNWFNNVETRTHPWEGTGLTWLTAALNEPDVRAATDFYTTAIGMAAIAGLEGDDGRLLFARIRYRGTNFTVNKEGWDSDAPKVLQHLSPMSDLYAIVDYSQKFKSGSI